ncbi:MAG: ParA family protein, partial [Pseudomonadota bacterium]|nr:ParA family protein [Pseudomonadota bacterium]
PSHGLPVIIYDKACTGTMAYLALAGEILGKQRKAATVQTAQAI